MHKPKEVALPDRVIQCGYTYVCSDEPLKMGDWYIDHQKHNWVYGNPIEDCNSESLAIFINKENTGTSWRSKKIIATDDPKLIAAGVPAVDIPGQLRDRFKIDMLQAFHGGCEQGANIKPGEVAGLFEDWFNKKYSHECQRHPNN